MQSFGRVAISVAAATALLAWSNTSTAFEVPMQNANSTLRYNTTYGAVEWGVERTLASAPTVGVDNLFYESFFWRVGSGSTRELGAGAAASGYNTGCLNVTLFGQTARQCGTTYDLFGYGKVRVTHTLLGGPDDSYRSTWITGLNFTADSNPGDLYFYSYADYRLGSSPTDDTLNYLGAGAFAQSDDNWRMSWDATLNPTHCTARGFNNVDGVPAEALGNLNDSCNYTGNAVFLAQWNNPDDFWIQRSVQVPLPATLALLGLGLAGLGISLRRKP